MNLENGRNNNADDYEEEEDEDEPDFMDNSGKCWEFGCKIRDEQHLKEWCQNKMGGMIVGKEKKLTRQFHCPIKECQFAAVFLKSCSIVYTRNKHNHGMENAKVKTPQYFGNDYVDIFGKIWKFQEEMGKNVQLEKIRTNYDLKLSLTNQSTLNLRCRKKGQNGVECKIKGIYVKANGCLYIRGEHNHIK